MHFRNGLLATAFVGYTIVVVAHASAQGAPQTPPPAGGAPQGQPAPGGRGQGRGGGRGEATFPAQQRPPGDPVLIERGKGLYTINCSACHGPDLRGGATGGPNLLRSAVVLNDQSGELILPIVRGARAERGMPALPLGDDDVKAVAEFIHSIVATARNQGAPPATEAPPPNALVGDASAGEKYFSAKCSSCHQPTGDLQGFGSRFPEAKALQNGWVAGGGGGRSSGRGGPQAAAPNRRTVTVTVTQPSGEKSQGRLVRIDNFIVTLEESDGSIRSFRRDGDRPKVEINDPMEGHRALLLVLTDKDMHDVTAYLATLK
jgi:cytochrome c oxidase cbb3-type subunit 3